MHFVRNIFVSNCIELMHELKVNFSKCFAIHGFVARIVSTDSTVTFHNSIFRFCESAYARYTSAVLFYAHEWQFVLFRIGRIRWQGLYFSKSLPIPLMFASACALGCCKEACNNSSLLRIRISVGWPSWWFLLESVAMRCWRNSSISEFVVAFSQYVLRKWGMCFEKRTMS